MKKMGCLVVVLRQPIYYGIFRQYFSVKIFEFYLRFDFMTFPSLFMPSMILSSGMHE